MTTIDIHLPRLFPDQRIILREAARFNVLDAGRRYGKTTIGVEVATQPILDGGPVAWVSMSWKNFTEVWRTMTAVLAPITTHKDEQEYRVETVISGGVFEAWTWKNIVSMRGRRYKRVIIDEAAYILGLMGEEDGYPDVVRPTLVDLRGDAWFLSSPFGHNDFETIFLRGQDRANWPAWRSWKRRTEDNPHIDPFEAADLRRELGARLAGQEMDAEFIDAADIERFLPSITLWDACQELLPPLDAHTPCVLAMDAGESSDTFATVLISWHPTRAGILACRYARAYVPRGAPLDFDAIEQDIRDLVQRYAVRQIAYDPFLLGQMMRRLSAPGRAVPTELASFPQGAARLEADKNLFDLIVQRRLAHDGNSDLRQHVTNADRKVDDESRKLRIVKRQHDLKIDLTIALSMGCARASEVLVPLTPTVLAQGTARGGWSNAARR